MTHNIGVILDLDKGSIKAANYGMITLARAGNAPVFALVMDSGGLALKADLEAFGITNIVEILLPSDQQHNPVVRAEAVRNAIKKFHISFVFGLSTPEGKDLLPRIAAQLEAPLVMDCFYVDLAQKLAKTSQYSGKTIASIKLKGEILVFGIRPNAVEPLPAPCTAQVLTSDATRLAAKGLKVIARGETGQGSPVSLVEADVIIAGGRGMKAAKNFTLLSRCAEKLGAAVGASRAAVDAGWVSYAMQVGQTGEKVNPRVYIACGISGSVQHFAGMKNAGMVIAINTDEKAPIMSNCDYYVKADALEMVAALIKVLEKGES